MNVTFCILYCLLLFIKHLQPWINIISSGSWYSSTLNSTILQATADSTGNIPIFYPETYTACMDYCALFKSGFQKSNRHWDKFTVQTSKHAVVANRCGALRQLQVTRGKEPQTFHQKGFVSSHSGPKWHVRYFCKHLCKKPIEGSRASCIWSVSLWDVGTNKEEVHCVLKFKWLLSNWCIRWLPSTTVNPQWSHYWLDKRLWCGVVMALRSFRGMLAIFEWTLPAFVLTSFKTKVQIIKF